MLSIFQPTAMMYWTMGVIYFLAGNNYDFSKKECRLIIMKYFFVGLVSIMIYAIISLKIIPFLTDVPVARGELVGIRYFHHKIKWFMTFPFKNAVNLWNIYPTFQSTIIISVIVFIGIIFGLLQEIKEKKTIFSSYFQKYFLIACLIIMSYFPNLIIRYNAYPYRTLTSLAAAMSVLFCFGLINIVESFRFAPNFSSEVRKKIITILLALLTIVTAFMANNNVEKFTTLYSNELKYVKNVIQGYGVPNLLRTLRIYVRRPKQRVNSPNPASEFSFMGILPTYSKAGPVIEVIKTALAETGAKQDIQIIHGAASDPVPEDKNVLIIDMTKFEFP
jgi:hypothetical protein